MLLGYTADRPVRETRANFENIVRVVAPPPRCVAGRVGSSVENWQLSRGQTPAWHWRSTHPSNSRSPPIGSRKNFRPMSRSYVQRHQQPALAAMTPARRRRTLRVAAAEASINLAERRSRQVRKPLGSNESSWVCLERLACRATKRVPPFAERQRSARERRRCRTMAPKDSRQQSIQNHAMVGSPRFRNCLRERG